MRGTNRSILALALLVLVACGKDEENNASQPNPAASQLGEMTFPDPATVGAVNLDDIPAGTYELSGIKTQRNTTKRDSTNYVGVHLLSQPGIFRTVNPTASRADWKGGEKGLRDRQYLYSYEELNLAMKIQASGRRASFSGLHYYYNKVRTDHPGELYWATEPGDSRGVRYVEVFATGTRNPGTNLYTTRFGLDSLEKPAFRGLAFFRGPQLVLMVEQQGLDTEGNSNHRILEFTYTRTGEAPATAPPGVVPVDESSPRSPDRK